MGSLQSPPMEPPNPARLYATAAGAFLVVLGIVGFFSSASFGSPGSVDPSVGVLRVNGWLNVLHIATGALGLLAAGYASRAYALAIGALYTALAIWGFAIGSGDAILGFLPANGGDDVLHLVLGLLGLPRRAGTPKRRPAKRRRGARAAARPRAEPAGQGP